MDAETAAQGLKLFKERSPDLILLDMKLPDGDGLEILKTLKSDDPSLPVIMMTAYGEVETAVESMKGGAYDFIPKGSLNLTEIATMIASIFKGDSPHLEVQMM